MLQRLVFTNFKSWPRAELTCGSITGLFGTNSSGKTSILQFLLLLKQTKEATDRLLSLELNGDYVELGTIRDAIHQHDDTLPIDMEITFGRDTPLVLSDPATRGTNLASDKEFTLATHLMVQQQAARTTQLTYRLGDHEFVLQQRSKGGDFELTHRGGGEFRFIRTTGRAWRLPAPIKGYAFPDQARTYYQNAQFLSDLEAAYEGNRCHFLPWTPARIPKTGLSLGAFQADRCRAAWREGNRCNSRRYRK
jgi:hypothetical protein